LIDYYINCGIVKEVTHNFSNLLKVIYHTYAIIMNDSEKILTDVYKVLKVVVDWFMASTICYTTLKL